MRRLWPVALLVILGAGVGGRAQSVEPGDIYLPDLRTLDPAEFHIAEQRNRTLLLLTNTVWNGGDGPLEMRPEHDEGAGITEAFQLLFTEDEGGNIVQLEGEQGERPAGSFAFHPEHDHWHFQDLARYELKRVKADGSPGKTLAASEKISYCMFDQMQVDPALENAAPGPHYSGSRCETEEFGKNAHIGYSVSWGDEYAYNFADQDIDITGIAPGRYWVRSTADPEGLIEETNNDNNAAQTAIALRMVRKELVVRTVTRTTGSVCAPCGTEELERGDDYVFRGSTDPSPGPRPAYPDPTMELSFKRAGTNDWRSFGGRSSNRAFTLLDRDDGSISIEGHWERAFVARKRGTWVLRARYGGNDDFTGSGVRTRVEVGWPPIAPRRPREGV